MIETALTCFRAIPGTLMCRYSPALRCRSRVRGPVLTALLLAALLHPGGGASGAEIPDPKKEDFSSLGQAVVGLLESGDEKAFAEIAAPSISDWRTALASDPDAFLQDYSGKQRATVESAAKQILAQTADLKVDFSRLRLTVAATPPKSIDRMQWQGKELPFVDQLQFTITAVALTNSPEVARWEGNYLFTLTRLTKFGPNWRFSEYLRFNSFPDTVADEETRRSLAILWKATRQEGLKLADDPALANLGAGLKELLQTQDEKVYEREAMPFDFVFKEMEKNAASEGEKPPKREEVEKRWNAAKEPLITAQRGVLEQMRQAGIDLRAADIKLKDAEFKSMYLRGGKRVLDGLEGNDLKITFSVSSNAKARNGASLAGDYVLAADEATRIGGRWLIFDPLRWHSLPTEIVGEKVKAALELENYAAEHGALPPNTPAPDVTFVRFDNGQTNRLSDLRGKIVILDFWSTTCGPCQRYLEEMQKYHESNPGWKDRVVVATLSIDETLKEARSHMDKRGWTNTFNLWAGEGGWQSEPAKAFRVRGVPTTYVIDTNGLIVKGDHPASLRAPEVVTGLLSSRKP